MRAVSQVSELRRFGFDEFARLRYDRIGPEMGSKVWPPNSNSDHVVVVRCKTCGLIYNPDFDFCPQCGGNIVGIRRSHIDPPGSFLDMLVFLPVSGD